ncbi:phage adaptor protein [Streptomyces scopuliridis]
MTTFDQLVSQVRQKLLGFSLSQESMSVLTVDMAASDITFQADGETISSISRGLAEIGDELVLIQKWDEASGTVTVLGGRAGRGYEGTTAATHSAGTLITSAPAFPRVRIKEAINETIQGLYPHLVVFGTVDFPFNAAQVEYPLPVDVRDVWYVTGRWVGPEKVSGPLPNWRYNPKAYLVDFPTGKSIQILDGVTPGQNIRIVYAKPPTALGAGTDDFAAVSGFPDRVSDLVVYGALKRTLPGLLGGRLQQQAIEATERAALVSTRDISQAIQMNAAMYAERLEEERSLMYTELPNYAMFQGS